MRAGLFPWLSFLIISIGIVTAPVQGAEPAKLLHDAVVSLGDIQTADWTKAFSEAEFEAVQDLRGSPIAVRIAVLRRDNPLHHLGFRAHDVVRAIKGKPTADLLELPRSVSQALNGESVSVDVIRAFEPGYISLTIIYDAKTRDIFRRKSNRSVIKKFVMLSGWAERFSGVSDAVSALLPVSTRFLGVLERFDAGELTDQSLKFVIAQIESLIIGMS